MAAIPGAVSHPDFQPTTILTRPLRDRIMDLAKATPEAYRAVAVSMYTTLNAVDAAGYDEYRVPATHELVLYEVHPHLVLTDLAGDVTARAPGGYVLTINDLIAAKAMNASLALRNSDRAQAIFENRSLSLGSLVTASGGQPFVFPDPHKIPAGELIRLDVQLGSGVVGAATQYGVILVGDLIRVAKS